MRETQTTAREEILQAAFQSLADRGSAAVTLRQIAREANVALSQIHYYFGSKEGLMVAAAAFVIRRQLVELQAVVTESSSPADRIRQAVRFVRTRLLQESQWSKVYLDLLTMSSWSPKLAEMTRQLQEELVKVTLAIAEQIDHPKFKSRALSRVIMAALDGLALQSLQGTAAEEMEAAYASLEEILLQLLQ